MTGQLLNKAARPLGKQVLHHPAAVPQSNTVVKSLLQGTSSSARNRQTLSKARWRRRPAASLTGQQRRRPPTIHWLLPVPLLCRAITSVQALPSSARYDAMRARCQLSTLCTPRRAGAGWRKASSRDAMTGKGHAGSQAHPRLLKHWLMQQPSLLCTGQATRRTPWHAQRQRWQGPHLGAKQGVEGVVEHAVGGLQAAGRAGGQQGLGQCSPAKPVLAGRTQWRNGGACHGFRPQLGRSHACGWARRCEPQITQSRTGSPPPARANWLRPTAAPAAHLQHHQASGQQVEIVIAGQLACGAGSTDLGRGRVCGRSCRVRPARADGKPMALLPAGRSCASRGATWQHSTLLGL